MNNLCCVKDFLQLPPVSKGREKKNYCFQAKSWKQCITRSIELTQIYRQKDRQFIAILQNIRIGRCPPAVVQLLKNTEKNHIEREGIKATRLYTHTEDVATTNQRELAALPGETRRFMASDSNSSLTEQLNNLCPVPDCVELKKGAQVMLVKNSDVSRGLVNGARGVVTGFTTTGKPTMRLSTGLEVTLTEEKWTVHLGGGNMATRRQLPVKLAWAISIHKSQGMTLDCVEMTLSRVFEDGQAYVALSRARSIDSLRVRDFSSSCVHADHEVLEYYRTLRRMRRHYISDHDHEHVAVPMISS